MKDVGRKLLASMLRIRRFEERCAELYGAGKIRGFLHLYIGEEAVAVGVMEALSQDDAIVATYREHGQALARGLPAGAVMAEMFGKATGCSRGRGGSMHLFDAKRRFYGGNAIVGAGLPIAVGLGLADRMQKTKRVTAVFFGDGAVEEGEFHESANLAALWRLPVVFVCENNLYAMGMPIALAEAQTDLCAKARSYGMPAESVDGRDVLAVVEAARAAVGSVRSTGGPFFLECRTYRFRAHSMFDPELYRTKAEVDEWKRRCPISTLDRKLRAAGLISDADLASIESDVTSEVDEAVRIAEAGPLEPVEDLLLGVLAPRGEP